MLEANEGLENIFENAVKEAEKRRHEYVTIEHVLLSLIKDILFSPKRDANSYKDISLNLSKNLAGKK